MINVAVKFKEKIHSLQGIGEYFKWFGKFFKMLEKFKSKVKHFWEIKDQNLWELRKFTSFLDRKGLKLDTEKQA